MKQQRTPWFPASVKPVHVGRYEYRIGGVTLKLHWTGKTWRTSGGRRMSVWPDDQWRGLVERPRQMVSPTL